MATTLGSVQKQPGDTITYEIDFTDWLTEMGDSASSVAAPAVTGITIVSAVISTTYVYVKISGGTTATDYLVTVTLTTTAGNVKEVEFTLKVRARP